MWEKVRCDGKKKLKYNAIPTLFPSLNKHFTEEVVFNDHNIEKGHDEDIGGQSAMLTLPFSQQTNQVEDEHTEENDLEYQQTETHMIQFSALEENNNVLVSMEKETNLRQQYEQLRNRLQSREQRFCTIIKKSQRYRSTLIKYIRKLNEEKTKGAKLLQKYEKNTKNAFKDIFNEDQILVLHKLAKKQKWSSDTIKKALRLRLACGSSGYQEILKQNIPFPSERTLRRRVELMDFKEGICNDVFTMLADQIHIFKNERDKDCMIALDEMCITSGLQFDQSTQSYCGYTTLPDNKSKSIFVYTSL